MSKMLVFSGHAQISVEGKGVLIPCDDYSLQGVRYSIGSEISRFNIIDYRKEVNQMAVSAIQNGGVGWSPLLFCQPALAKVTRDGDCVNVELEEYIGLPFEYPILWIGVFEGDEMLANPVQWLDLTDTGDGRTAFVGLVIPSKEFQLVN